MSIVPYLTMGLLAFVSVMLIFIVLLQRGRGGGLAGALGGAGGQSAFGTKAGDVFTRITIVLAVIWVLLGAMNVVLLRNLSTGRFAGGTEASTSPVLTAPEETSAEGAAGAAAPAGGATKPAAVDEGAKSAEPPAKTEETKTDETKSDSATKAGGTKSEETKAETPAPAETPKEGAKPDAAPGKPAAEEKKPE
jgi:preprotein translocase subunit SecG